MFRLESKVTSNAAINLQRGDASACLACEATSGDYKGDDAASAYRALTGSVPEEATIENDENFDRHVFASILALALTEDGGVGERVGLGADDLEALLAQWFLQSGFRSLIREDNLEELDHEEIEMVRNLLLANRSSEGEVGRWLAAMVARRTMEPNHLWEDLGLRNRSELTRLLERHFRPLADRNDRNMRWKRFFYRMMCEDDGFVMCSTPICTNCADYGLCFGEESGESRLRSTRDRTDEFRR